MPAAAGLARASIAIFNYTRTERDASQARAAIDAALKLDPDLPEMRAARAWLYLNDGPNWAAAEAEIKQAMRYFRAALSHDPFNSGTIMHSASCLLRSGHLVEAEEQIH